MERKILCIDLKSFFASCECVERNLNPFSTPLVVAEPNRNGAITLAVTPYLKTKGVPSRGRVYALPKNINIIKARPRMSLYLKKSKEVMGIYLDFVAPEDLHVYSVDEAFLDVTDYLKLYQISDYELAVLILKTVHSKTGLTATCGIGPNLLLAKVAMDIEAKKKKDNIAKWTKNDIPQKLWTISPLSIMWGIGSRMEKRLNNMGITSIYDIAHYDPLKLKEKFGVRGLELYEHANGIDESKISDFKNVVKNKSYGHSQILFKDYNDQNILLIISEMLDILMTRLRKNRKLTCLVSFGIGYSKTIGGGFYHSLKLDNPTDNKKIIYDTIINIFNSYYEDLPIRKVSISLGKLTNKNGIQLNLFEQIEDIKKDDNINYVIDSIKEKYGKNSLLKASALLKDSTAKERNNKIGGHHE